MTNSAGPGQLASEEEKPTDLDLHWLLRKGMSCSAREGICCRTSLETPCREAGRYIKNMIIEHTHAWRERNKIKITCNIKPW